MIDENEFVKLIQENDRIIHKVVGLYADTKEDKKDLYQETLLQLWKSVKNFRREASFTTFMYKVALNVALSFNKKSKRIQTTTLDNANELSASISDKEDYEILYLTIKNLIETDRMIITLHLDGYKNIEIAEITGMTTNNVNVKIHRIKEKITHEFKKIDHGYQ